MRQRLRMRALRIGASRRGFGADDQDRVGLLDAGDGRVEQIGGAAEPGRQRRAVLPAIDVRRAERTPSALQREHLLDGREIARDGADALRARRLSRLAAMAAKASAQVAGRSRPFSRRIRPVEPLRLAARRRCWRVLSEIHSSLMPSLTRGRMRMTSRPRASTRMLEPTASITSIDCVLVSSQGRAVEGLRLVGQRADRAEVGDVAPAARTPSRVRDRS